MNSDVIVVGAGLSGLYTAYLLKKQNINVTVVEARNRAGGRVLSEAPEQSDEQNVAAVDLGPSWFWPWQSRMLALLKELELDSRVYEQYSQGLAVAEYRTGQLAQQNGMASMAGSLRLAGGLQALANTLCDYVGSENIYYGYRITEVCNNSIIARDAQGSSGKADAGSELLHSSNTNLDNIDLTDNTDNTDNTDRIDFTNNTNNQSKVPSALHFHQTKQHPKSEPSPERRPSPPTEGRCPPATPYHFFRFVKLADCGPFLGLTVGCPRPA